MVKYGQKRQNKQKPKNDQMTSNYVFMPILVEIAQNSTKTIQNYQIWPETSKWPKNLKMVYCTQVTFLCPFESKSLKTHIKRLKMVKYGQKRQNDSKTSKWSIALKLRKCPFESKSLKPQLKWLKMVKYSRKRQNDLKTSKWYIALKLRFYAHLSRNRSKPN